MPPPSFFPVLMNRGVTQPPDLYPLLMERDDLQPVRNRVPFIFVPIDQAGPHEFEYDRPICVVPSTDLDHVVPERVNCDEPQGTVIFNVDSLPADCVPVTDTKFIAKGGQAFRVKGSNRVYVAPTRKRKLDA